MTCTRLKQTRCRAYLVFEQCRPTVSALLGRVQAIFSECYEDLAFIHPISPINFSVHTHN